jgi:GAF domain-containing protein
MMQFLRSLFTITYPYQNQIQRQRARGLLVVIWVSVIAWVGYILGVALPSINAGNAPELVLNPGLAVVPFMAVLNLILVQNGRLQFAALLLVIASMASTLPLLFTSPDALLPLAAMLPLVAGGVLLRRGAFLPVALVIIGVLVLRALWLSGFTDEYIVIPANNVNFNLVAVLVAYGSAAAFLYAFSGSAERTTSSALDEARLMASAARYGATLESQASETDVLGSAMRLLQDDFDFFNVQLYLQDDEGHLIRRGRMTLGRMGDAQQQRAPADSLAGSAAAERHAIVADRSAAADIRGLVAAPARKALAVPLLVGDTLLGVLEAQSDNERPFSKAQVAAVELLAGQTARAMLSARRLADAESAAREAQTSLANMATQMREMSGVGARALKAGWDSYLQRFDAPVGYDININGRQTVTRAADLPDTLREAMQSGQLVTTDTPDGQVINIPIITRGELLGAMSFQLPVGRALTERQIELARSVAERLGTTLDNTRLFEQSQIQVQRERQANQVASRLLGVTDVQTVLDLAAADFQTALGAVYTQIYVSGVQEEPRDKRETSS